MLTEKSTWCRTGFRCLYDNAPVRRLHELLMGKEFDATGTHPRGEQGRLFLQKWLVFSISSSVAAFVFMSFQPVTKVLALLISLVPFMTLYFLRVALLKGRLKRERVSLERVMPLLRLMIRFLLKIADGEHDVQKIFVDSMQYISLVEGKSPFKDLRRKMVLGVPIEHILYAFNSPSRDLNELVHACRDVRSFPFVCADQESFSQHKVFLKTLESRMVIVVAEAIFLPILASLMFAFQSVDVGIHVVLVLVHVVTLKLLSRALLFNDAPLLYLVGAFPDQSRRMLDGFLSFLVMLGKNTRHHSLEYAWVQTWLHASREVKQMLGIDAIENIRVSGFRHKMEAVSMVSKSSVVRVVFNLIGRFADYASVDLAGFIIDVVTELKRQKEIEEERINTINAERFKVKVLVVCLTIILSFLSVLFPLFSDGLNGVFFEPFSSKDPQAVLSPLLFVANNAFYNYTSCLYLVRITGLPTAHRYALGVTLVFAVIVLAGVSSARSWG